jgi:DNA-binding SARP family transcriptional activator
MSSPRYGTRIILAGLAALLVLTVLALLWDLRPGLPTLPGSWSALFQPTSSTELEQVGLFIVWLVLALLLVLLALGALDEIGDTLAERREERLDAFATRVAPKPAPRTRPGPRRPPLPGKITMTIAPPRETATEGAALREPQRQAAPQATTVDRDNAPSISILGPPRITGAKPRRGRLRTATEQLLIYLVLHPDGARSEELIEAIWPGKDPHKTKPRLWQSAADARKVIGDTLARDGDRYQLDRTRLRIDFDELEDLLAQARRTEDPATQQQLLEQALSLFRGEPLSGTDYPWADPDIRHLDACLVDLLQRNGSARLAAGDARGALQAAERGLALDEYNEALWRLALQAEHALGLRESVTRRYRELARTLDEQLGLQPSQETRMTYRRLLGQT